MSPTGLEGRVTRKKSNALVMTFYDGHVGADGRAVPFATADQGGGDGRGARLGVLFGFKNGGPGRHRVAFADGSVVFVESRDSAPTLLTDDTGTVASIERGDTSTALDADGRVLLRILSADDAGRSADQVDAVVAGADDRPIGTVRIVRTPAGWRTLEDVVVDPVLNGWVDVQLKTPVLGVQILLDAPVDEGTRRLLVAVGVDIAIGLRPYVTAQQR